jgi:2-hydroxy-6-oxonona-2,4-dienedioate hydrolase
VLNATELTDALVGWTRAAGLERAAYLGNSFGCQIVADLALRYPALIEGAVYTFSRISRSLMRARHT